MSEHRHVKAWLALVGYVILPAVIIGRMLMVYPELPTQRLLGMLISAASIGVLLVLLALAASRFPRGSYARLGLNLAFVAGVLVWFLAIMGWSTTINMTYEEYAFQLHLTKYLWLLIAVGLLNSAYYFAETSVYHEHPVEQSMADEASAGMGTGTGSEGEAHSA